MQKDLLNNAVIIRDETLQEHNTALRVGRFLIELAQTIGLKIEPSNIQILSDVDGAKIRLAIYDANGEKSVTDIEIPVLTGQKSGIITPGLLSNILQQIKEKILTRSDLMDFVCSKFGYERAILNRDLTYSIQSFSTFRDADKYDTDPTLFGYLLLNSYKIRTIDSCNIATYKLRCINNLDSLAFSIYKNSECVIDFTFTSTNSEGINTNEIGICKIYLKNSEYASFTPIETFEVQSNDRIKHNISKYLSDGNNSIMIKITGNLTDETSPAIVYSVYLKIYKLKLEITKGEKIYRDGQGFVARIEASVYMGDDNITANYDKSQFVWTRESENKVGDKDWNTIHINIGNIIDITTDDLVGQTTIFMQLYESNGTISDCLNIKF